MKSFRLETKREPRIALPSSMSYVTEGVQYVGVLKGYYVPNTNYYLSSTYKCNFLGADNKQ